MQNLNSSSQNYTMTSYLKGVLKDFSNLVLQGDPNGAQVMKLVCPII